MQRETLTVNKFTAMLFASPVTPGIFSFEVYRKQRFSQPERVTYLENLEWQAPTQLAL